MRSSDLYVDTTISTDAIDLLLGVDELDDLIKIFSSGVINHSRIKKSDLLTPVT